MNVETLKTPLSALLGQKVASFEACFTYPYGEDKRFRIDHGKDYNAFYRAMGRAQTFYIHHNNQIIGTISASVREVLVGERCINLAYIGDLKIIEAYRGTRAIVYLLKALRSFLEPYHPLAYAVVMKGTSASPTAYTGKAGIPSFQPISKRFILRLATDCAVATFCLRPVSEKEGWRVFSSMNGAFTPLRPSDSSVRSVFQAAWLVAEGAVGMVEDTGKAKRLYFDDGEEMRSAHLSYFAFSESSSAKTLIAEALAIAKARGFPHMFLALDGKQYNLLSGPLSFFTHDVAEATLYATDLSLKSLAINTAEI